MSWVKSGGGGDRVYQSVCQYFIPAVEVCACKHPERTVWLCLYFICERVVFIKCATTVMETGDSVFG